MPTFLRLTGPHHNIGLNDRRILPFVDIKAKVGIKHISDKEEDEGIKDDKGSYEASIHGSTLTTLNVLITLWTLICVSNFLLYFHLCPETSISKKIQCLHQFIFQTYMNSRNIV